VWQDIANAAGVRIPWNYHFAGNAGRPPRRSRAAALLSFAGFTFFTPHLADLSNGEYNVSRWRKKEFVMNATKTGKKAPRGTTRPMRNSRGRPKLIEAAGTTAVTDRKQRGDSIGVRYDTQLQAAGLVEAGLPFSVIARFQKTSGLTFERIKKVARISEGSFARRKQSGRLSQDESERLLRLARVYECAVGLYDGDQAGALQWLETPVPALGNQRPLDAAQTEPGAREVEDLIGRIEHGVVS
jgi:putative toxin-antitoxin system antitoxin component (TIGR02293 family)